MKKTLSTLAVSAMILALFSCASNNQAQADSYGDDEAQKVTEIKVQKEKKTAKEESDPYNKKKMTGNMSFSDKMFNINKFQKMDSFSVFLKPTFGKAFSRKAHLIYRPGTDVAGFSMYYDSSAYAIQFASTARAALRRAVDEYIADFEGKKLDSKNKKSDQTYGYADAYMDYGIVEGMMTNAAKPRVYFGYRFLKSNPYFTIYVKKAQNIEATSKSEQDMMRAESIEMHYYFTRAQARALADFLSDENILPLFEDSSPSPELEVQDDYTDSYGE